MRSEPKSPKTRPKEGHTGRSKCWNVGHHCMNRTRNGHRFEGINVASGPMRGSSKIDPGLVRPKSDPKVSNDERKGLADPCYVVCLNAAIIAAQQNRQPKVPPPLPSTNGHRFLPGATEHCSINKRCRRPSTWSTSLSTLCRWPMTCLTPSPEKGGRSAGRKCNSPNVVPHTLHWMLTKKGKKAFAGHIL
jgi:hypothetical protein